MTASANALTQLEKWLATANGHFVRCKGEIHGDSAAWHDIYHDPAITNQTVEDWLDIIETLRLGNPSLVSPRLYDIFKEARKYIVMNGHKPRCFDKGIGRYRQQPLFKPFMEIRDFFNRINGWEMPKPKKPDDDPSHWDSLFDIKD
jgi:hypothetical protein